MSGVLLPEPLVLFGVELELGLVEVLEPVEPLMSELLELEGEVEVLELDGEVEFMSELLEPVVDDGEVEVLEPDCVAELDGELELCALEVPLPAPLPSFEVLLLL